MSSALSIYELFMSLMYLVNGAQFSIIKCFLLFSFTPSAAEFGAVIVSHTSIYQSLWSNKLDLNVNLTLNLVWLLALFVVHDALFNSTYFVVLNLLGLFGRF